MFGYHVTNLKFFISKNKKIPEKMQKMSNKLRF